VRYGRQTRSAEGSPEEPFVTHWAVIAQGANLAASVITARLLGREQFGEYGIVQSTVGMLGVFAGLGLGVTATRYVAEFRTSDPARAGRIVALGVLLLLSPGAAGDMSLRIRSGARRQDDECSLLGERTSHACVLLFFNALNGAQIGALSGFEAFPAIARINLGRGLIALPVTIAAVAIWRLPGAIWALPLRRP